MVDKQFQKSTCFKKNSVHKSHCQSLQVQVNISQQPLCIRCLRHHYRDRDHVVKSKHTGRSAILGIHSDTYVLQFPILEEACNCWLCHGNPYLDPPSCISAADSDTRFVGHCTLRAARPLPLPTCTLAAQLPLRRRPSIDLGILG
jgi:hypothetical protein